MFRIMRSLPFKINLKKAPRLGRKKTLAGNLFAHNTLANGVLLAAGDSIEQQIETYGTIHRKSIHDWSRTARMLVVGFATGPPQQFYYTWLERSFPGKTIFAIIAKTTVDQVFASPIMIVVFFLGVGVLEGRRLKDDIRELKNKFWNVYLVDCLVWPTAQAINFRYVPLYGRLLFMSCVSLFFNIYLCYAHFDMPETKDNVTTVVLEERMEFQEILKKNEILAEVEDAVLAEQEDEYEDYAQFFIEHGQPSLVSKRRMVWDRITPRHLYDDNTECSVEHDVNYEFGVEYDDAAENNDLDTMVLEIEYDTAALDDDTELIAEELDSTGSNGSSQLLDENYDVAENNNKDTV